MPKAQAIIESLTLEHHAAPLHRQIYSHLRRMIEQNVLPGGTRLSSTRMLATEIGVGRNTVIAAYEQLAAEGYIALQPGLPPQVTHVAGNVRKARRAEKEPNPSARGELMLAQPYHHGEPGQLAFHPGMPDAGSFPFNTWSKILARRTKHAGLDLFGTYHVTGYPALREALATYLGASRGVQCAPEQVIITNGAQAGFDLLARLLLDEGDPVWLEEPGYYGAGAAFLAAGAQLLPLPVGEDGWNLSPPPRAPRVIYVTPSCHHPYGLTMPLEQRLRLLELAERWNSWIIEDDYDSEYRFQGQAIPALQGISGAERVVYVGTFAKLLFPAMRLGFMVVPPHLAERAAAALSVTGQFAPLVTQAAIADFIDEGHLGRHLRRMRKLYGQRRQAFSRLCAEMLGEHMQLRPAGSGIQMVGLLRKPLRDWQVAEAARRHKVNVSALSMQFRGPAQSNGLLLGFAAVDEKAMRKGLAKLREAMQECLKKR